MMLFWALWLGAMGLRGQTNDDFCRRWTLDAWSIEPVHTPHAARLRSLLEGRTVMLSFDNDGEFLLELGNETATGHWSYVPQMRTLIFEPNGSNALRATVDCMGERMCLTMRDGGTILNVEWTPK